MVNSVSSSFSLYAQYSNYYDQWPDAASQKTADGIAAGGDLDPLKDLSPEEQQELFLEIFEVELSKYLINQNGQVSSDSELVAVREKFHQNGTQFSFDQEQHNMPQFNEYGDIVEDSEPEYFIPASFLNAHALLKGALIDVFRATLGVNTRNLQQVRPIEMPAWQESCVGEVLCKNSVMIDTSVVVVSQSERFRPLDKDISRQVDVQKTTTMFTIKSVMIGAGAPAPETAPLTTSQGATFASFAAPKDEAITIEENKARNSNEVFANASSGQTGAYKVKVNYIGPKIPYNTAHNACGRFASFLATCAAEGVPTDINALILWVLRESYQEGNNILADVRDRVKYFNKLKDQIRDVLKELNKKKSEYTKAAADYVAQKRQEYIKEKGDEDDTDDVKKYGNEFDAKLADDVRGQFDISGAEIYRYQFSSKYYGQDSTMDKGSKKLTTMSELESYIKEMENNLASVGDDAQTQNINLQSAMQKQTQLIQTLSNLQKLLHDTALSIVQKLS